MRVSIVVPALDEADGIAATLVPLQPLRAAGHEVVVVDGGSADATLAIARPLADLAFAATRGRAAQMNAGAAAATGDVLMFLHADTRLPDDAIGLVTARLREQRRRWGRFDVAIEGRSRALSAVAATMNLRSRLTGIATGDQTLFVERPLFEAAGGFPRQPLMEDVEFSRRLKRTGGRPLCLRAKVVTSGRRWDRRGVARTIAEMWRLRLAHWRGVNAEALVAQYPDIRAGNAPRNNEARNASGCDAAMGAEAPFATTSPHPAERVRSLPRLQVFAKAPTPGAVKTRLARAIGAPEAARVHAQLVERTLTTARTAQAAGIVGSVELWCAPDANDPAFAEWRERFGVSVAAQTGTDLGERMRSALGTALARRNPVILVGCDCPVLDVEYLAAAARALDRHDAVFGPAEDGGYVLVGLSRPVDAFEGIAWGRPEVMAATRAKLAAAAVSWFELPMLWDVDRETDLARWRHLEAAVA